MPVSPSPSLFLASASASSSDSVSVSYSPEELSSSSLEERSRPAARRDFVW